MSNTYFRQFAAVLLTDQQRIFGLDEETELCLDYSPNPAVVSVYDVIEWTISVNFELLESKVPSVLIFDQLVGEDGDYEVLGTLPISVILNNDPEWKQILAKLKEVKQ